MHATELELVTDSPADSPADSPLAPGQGSATVIELAATGFVIDVGGVPIEAQRAASCLLEPALGDRVWFVAEPGHDGSNGSSARASPCLVKRKRSLTGPTLSLNRPTLPVAGS